MPVKVRRFTSTEGPAVRRARAPRVFVTGDLNIDLTTTGVVYGGITKVAATDVSVGGAAFNAARAFRRSGFRTVVCGKVGDDAHGRLLRARVRSERIASAIGVDARRPTGTCLVLYPARGERTIFYPAGSANDYDLRQLERALGQHGIGARDYVMAPLHLVEQLDGNVRDCRRYLDCLRSSGARVIVDVVPHRLYERLSLRGLRAIVGRPVYLLIVEYGTLARLLGERPGARPRKDLCRRFAAGFEAEWLDCRFGAGNISELALYRRAAQGGLELVAHEPTGYGRLEPLERRGFGDEVTARTLRRLCWGEGAGRRGDAGHIGRRAGRHG